MMFEKRALENEAFLKGETCYLRPVREEDATPEYVSWLNDAETTRFMESGFFPSTRKSVRDFIQSTNQRTDTLFLAIVLPEEHRHVGNVKLGPINWVHRNAEFGILVGAPEARGRGIGTEATKLILAHAFERLNLHRVGLGVVADNDPAIRSYRKVGFEVEGTYRQAILREGEFRDLCRMGILASDFQRLHGSPWG